MVLGTSLVATGFVLGAMGGAGKPSYFALGAALFGSMVFAFVRPIYGDESAVFCGVGVVLCCVGALVSGAAATLLPAFSVSASAGALLGLPVLLALGGRWNPGLALDTYGSHLESAVSIVAYVGLASLGGAGLRRAERLVEPSVFAGCGMWLAVLGVDRACFGGEALWDRLVVAARGDKLTRYAAGDDDGWLDGSFEAVGVAVWIVATTCLALARAATSGLWLRPRRNGYDRLSTTTTTTTTEGSSLLGASSQQRKASEPEARQPTAGATQQAGLLAERPSAFNLFDPERLPATLQRFAPQIFASAEALGNFFGFQDDSVRNQAEHALALLANSLSQQQRWYEEEDEDDESPLGEEAEDAAVRALHAKLFSNYRSWCAALETVPQFAPPAETRHEAGGAATDIMLWLCIWGEGANLRHMPECLCFLYHSAAAEWASTPKRERDGERGATLEAGHWLDTVVQPIYAVVAANMRRKADHVDKLSYDDINELFWNKSCLECHRSGLVTPTARRHLERRASARRAQQTTEGSTLLSSAAEWQRPPAIADRLKAAPKTFLEVRTWTHVVFAFQRVYEFHVLAFLALAVVGFARFLVWDWTYALQVASILAAAQNACALAWAVLEALFAPPAFDDLQRVALCARLAARYIALVVQVTYLSWSFDALEAMPVGEVRRTGDCAFWWWQHIWISAVIMAAYFVEAGLQLWPRGMTRLLELRGDLSQALLAIFEPRLSALYVGKSVHEPYSLAWKYHVYWASLIGFKLWFGYKFLVEPLVPPSVQIYDDYLNFPQVPDRTLKTAAQLAGRWMPSVFIFLVDSSIWYSLWAAAVGTYVGFAAKLGVVRDLSSLRDAFLLLPRAFCERLVAGGLEDRAAKPEQPDDGLHGGPEDALNGRRRPPAVKFRPDAPGQRPAQYFAGIETSPRASVAPDLRRYFDDNAGPLARQREASCLCCGDEGAHPGPAQVDARAPSPTQGLSSRMSPRSLGALISPPSSGTELSTSLSLGAAGMRLAPRLPSFLSLTDAHGSQGDSLLGRGGKAELGGPDDAARHPRSGLVELMEPSSARQRRTRVSEVFSGAEDEEQWILFAEAWNEVIDAMRASDILSNKERDILAFDRFSGFSKPVYLPIFVTAGAMERASALAADAVSAYRPLADAAAVCRRDAADLENGASFERQADKYAAAAHQVKTDLARALEADVVASEALDEVRELATWLLLRLLGNVHRDDVIAVVSIIDRWSRGTSAVPGETVLDRVKLEDAPRSVLVPMTQLIDLLLKGLPKRKLGASGPATGASGAAAAHKGEVSPVPSQANLTPPTPPPTPVTSFTDLVLASDSSLAPAKAAEFVGDSGAAAAAPPDHEARFVHRSSTMTADREAPPSEPSSGGGGGGMKRTQSTSGLVAMATGLADLGAPPATSQNTKKYSLSSNKYVVTAEKDAKSGRRRVVETPDPFRDGVRDKLRAFLSGLKSSVIAKGASPGLAGKSAQEVSDRITFVLANERGFFWEGTYAGLCLDTLRGDLERVTKILKKLKGLLSTPQRETEPRGHEAIRRLTFFVNSLLMDLPPPPPVEAMVSFTTLTPFYSEDVILSKADLLARNTDGVTTLLYLQTLYKADWANFLERREIGDETAVFKPEHELETRLWASFRAQTLARTVEGMMHCEAALRLLARLERLNAVRQARRYKDSGDGHGGTRMIMPGSSGTSVDEVVRLKFGYVVSCQVYGKQKKNADPKAKDIELLLHRFPLLRVAYIDELRVNRSGAVAYYSCLVKAAAPRDSAAAAAAAKFLKEDSGGSSDRPLQTASAPAHVAAPEKSASGGRAAPPPPPPKADIVEIYRVRLPGNPVIGEGKPENQSHAIVFTRGECLQTIDMNQDGFFEEALKMRNLLQEFRPGAPGVPKIRGSPPTVIVGFREHIFTGSVSSLANYMALQELSFVTLGQRVLSDPLRMRLHYGHPDVFDKLWFATRGGVSKASKGINLSEDIFAGYTALIRGGSVAMKEYCQVGKGRDVGMQQIYKFEAKLSQGNAEQCLSRDASRVADRLDFPRLLSYYFGGVGHYINSALTIATIQLATYLVLVLAVFGAESIGGRQVVPLGAVQIVLAGLGLLNTLPLLATLAVERGLLPALRDVLQVFASGGPLYFIFHIQTRAHYFTQTLLAGGASYKATGRGFVTRHSTFDEQYRFFATSHLYLGVELAAALVLVGVYSEARQYAGRTWSLWLATAAFLLSPFWFNPLGFSWPHVTDDFYKWSRWISPYTHGGTSADSWEVWYKEETAVYRRLSWKSKLLLGSKALLYAALARGIAWKSGADDSAKTRRLEMADLFSFASAVAALAALLLASYCVDAVAYRLHYALHRLLKMLLGIATVIFCAGAFISHTSFFHFAISLYYLAAAVNTVGTLLGTSFVRHLQRLHDALVGYAFFLVFILLSALHVFDLIQTWLLFHNAVSQGVVVDNILKQARRSQEADNSLDASEEIRDLRRIVDQQQRTISDLLANATSLDRPQPPAPAPEVVSDSNLRAVRATPATTFDLAPGPPPSTATAGFTFQSPDQMPPRA